MFSILEIFFSDDEGVTTIEYGLVAALIGLGLSAALISTSDSLGQLFFRVADCFSSPRGPLCL
jgi:Flp pilus assembly pilin Flp